MPYLRLRAEGLAVEPSEEAPKAAPMLASILVQYLEQHQSTRWRASRPP